MPITDMTGIDWLKKLAAETLTTAPATDVQALAESSSTLALVPSNLAALGSTATFAGLVELATNAEAILGTDTVRAVTPAGAAAITAKVSIILFAGRNLIGACTATGLKVLDHILSVTGIVVGDVGDKSALFETVVTVADQIQQASNTDLSTHIYLALVLRKS